MCVHACVHACVRVFTSQEPWEVTSCLWVGQDVLTVHLNKLWVDPEARWIVLEHAHSSPTASVPNLSGKLSTVDINVLWKTLCFQCLWGMHVVFHRICGGLAKVSVFTACEGRDSACVFADLLQKDINLGWKIGRGWELVGDTIGNKQK